MRAITNFAPVVAFALSLGLSGCGGAADVGDAEIVPAAPSSAEKPAVAVEAKAPAATAPEPEPAKAP